MGSTFLWFIDVCSRVVLRALCPVVLDCLHIVKAFYTYALMSPWRACPDLSSQQWCWRVLDLGPILEGSLDRKPSQRREQPPLPTLVQYPRAQSTPAAAAPGPGAPPAVHTRNFILRLVIWPPFLSHSCPSLVVSIQVGSMA